MHPNAEAAIALLTELRMIAEEDKKRGFDVDMCEDRAIAAEQLIEYVREEHQRIFALSD